MNATDAHEMRMVNGKVRAVYTDGNGDEYIITDGDKRFIERSVMATVIRYSQDGSVSMVWEDGEPLRCPTQHDMDTLPVGPDMTDEEVESLDQ